MSHVFPQFPRCRSMLQYAAVCCSMLLRRNLAWSSPCGAATRSQSSNQSTSLFWFTTWCSNVQYINVYWCILMDIIYSYISLHEISTHMTQNHVNRISGRSECLAWRFVCWRHELWSTSWHRACLAQEAQWRQDVPATCWMLMGQMICRKRQRREWLEWQCVLMSENNRSWKLSPLGHLPPEERLSWSTSELDLGLLPPFLGYRNFRRLWSISAKRKTNRKKTNRIKHPFKKNCLETNRMKRKKKNTQELEK